MGPLSSKYDSFFQRYSLEFFGQYVDWRWFKAQGLAESNLNPLAVSPVGAKGIMQVMPATAVETAERLNLGHFDLTDPETNIRIGISYDLQCFNFWKNETGVERFRFMFASYNAGCGNILKAQRLAAITNQWGPVSGHLPEVTEDNAWQTIDYVKHIEAFYSQIKAATS
ncbi:MAG: transglycosylase SLT domain-containing protein [Desulfocapsaceae bacterium]|nr:transglycosylase SLT domain-containing protein [Desulfocapsaceae bacterium]